MANPNGAKGKRWELDLFQYLMETHGRQVRRPHQEGYEDVGDLHLSPFVIQAKNYKTVAEALNLGLSGAQVQAVRAEEPYGVVAVKRRGKGTADGYIAMTVATFNDLVARLREAEELAWRYRELSR